jgi:hypothetical protein
LQLFVSTFCEDNTRDNYVLGCMIGVEGYNVFDILWVWKARDVVMEVLERWVQSNDNVLWLFERELGLKRRVSDRKIGVALCLYKNIHNKGGK